ncbi:unnamed protein product [Amoebophrya sp. A120]|nr:unnamed protein product [Amoebophrya sp. A120]|eukprot:GSA120T00012746001.1
MSFVRVLSPTRSGTASPRMLAISELQGARRRAEVPLASVGSGTIFLLRSIFVVVVLVLCLGLVPPVSATNEAPSSKLRRESILLDQDGSVQKETENVEQHKGAGSTRPSSSSRTSFTRGPRAAPRAEPVSSSRTAPGNRGTSSSSLVSASFSGEGIPRTGSASSRVQERSSQAAFDAVYIMQHKLAIAGQINDTAGAGARNLSGLKNLENSPLVQPHDTPASRMIKPSGRNESSPVAKVPSLLPAPSLAQKTKRDENDCAGYDDKGNLQASFPLAFGRSMLLQQYCGRKDLSTTVQYGQFSTGTQTWRVSYWQWHPTAVVDRMSQPAIFSGGAYCPGNGLQVSRLKATRLAFNAMTGMAELDDYGPTCSTLCPDRGFQDGVDTDDLADHAYDPKRFTTKSRSRFNVFGFLTALNPPPAAYYNEQMASAPDATSGVPQFRTETGDSRNPPTTASCLADEVMVGGGCDRGSSGMDECLLAENRPASSGTGWSCAYVCTGNNVEHSVDATAVCIAASFFQVFSGSAVPTFRQNSGPALYSTTGKKFGPKVSVACRPSEVMIAAGCGYHNDAAPTGATGSYNTLRGWQNLEPFSVTANELPELLGVERHTDMRSATCVARVSPDAAELLSNFGAFALCLAPPEGPTCASGYSSGALPHPVCPSGYHSFDAAGCAAAGSRNICSPINNYCDADKCKEVCCISKDTTCKPCENGMHGAPSACTGPGEENCASCDEGYILHGTACVPVATPYENDCAGYNNTDGEMQTTFPLAFGRSLLLQQYCGRNDRVADNIRFEHGQRTNRVTYYRPAAGRGDRMVQPTIVSGGAYCPGNGLQDSTVSEFSAKHPTMPAFVAFNGRSTIFDGLGPTYGTACADKANFNGTYTPTYGDFPSWLSKQYNVFSFVTALNPPPSYAPAKAPDVTNEIAMFHTNGQLSRRSSVARCAADEDMVGGGCELNWGTFGGDVDKNCLLAESLPENDSSGGHAWRCTYVCTDAVTDAAMPNITATVVCFASSFFDVFLGSSRPTLRHSTDKARYVVSGSNKFGPQVDVACAAGEVLIAAGCAYWNNAAPQYTGHYKKLRGWRNKTNGLDCDPGVCPTNIKPFSHTAEELPELLGVDRHADMKTATCGARVFKHDTSLLESFGAVALCLAPPEGPTCASGYKSGALAHPVCPSGYHNFDVADCVAAGSRNICSPTNNYCDADKCKKVCCNPAATTTPPPAVNDTDSSASEDIAASAGVGNPLLWVGVGGGVAVLALLSWFLSSQARAHPIFTQGGSGYYGGYNQNGGYGDNYGYGSAGTPAWEVAQQNYQYGYGGAAPGGGQYQQSYQNYGAYNGQEYAQY